MDHRTKALDWWSELSFEQKFYYTVEWLSSQGRDTTERHPDNLTGREIEEIFNLIL